MLLGAKRVLSWCLTLLMASSITVLAQTGPPLRERVLEDPVFGIGYRPRVVKYDEIPARLKELCNDFRDGRYWVYAHTRVDRSEYFIVMGITKGQEGDSLGNAVWIQDSKCQVGDSLWTLSGVPMKQAYGTGLYKGEMPGIGAPEVCDRQGDCHYNLRSDKEEAILRDIVKDAIQKAVAAYGDEDQFKKKACSPSVVSGDPRTPVVQQELQKFCGGSRH